MKTPRSEPLHSIASVFDLPVADLDRFMQFTHFGPSVDNNFYSDPNRHIEKLWEAMHHENFPQFFATYKDSAVIPHLGDQLISADECDTHYQLFQHYLADVIPYIVATDVASEEVTAFNSVLSVLAQLQSIPPVEHESEYFEPGDFFNPSSDKQRFDTLVQSIHAYVNAWQRALDDPAFEFNSTFVSGTYEAVLSIIDVIMSESQTAYQRPASRYHDGELAQLEPQLPVEIRESLVRLLATTINGLGTHGHGLETNQLFSLMHSLLTEHTEFPLFPARWQPNYLYVTGAGEFKEQKMDDIVRVSQVYRDMDHFVVARELLEFIPDNLTRLYALIDFAVSLKDGPVPHEHRDESTLGHLLHYFGDAILSKVTPHLGYDAPYFGTVSQLFEQIAQEMKELAHEGVIIPSELSRYYYEQRKAVLFDSGEISDSVIPLHA